MSDIIFTDANFEQEVLKSDTPVVVDFWAEWCAPCRIVSPTIDEVGKEYEGKVKVGKFNVDENPDNPSKYGVMSIPTILIFKNGTPVKTLVGARPKENYKNAIDEVLSA